MHQIKIFLVDDDTFTLQLHAQHLNNLGFTNVQQMNDGFSCLKKLQEKPAVVFLDHNMDEITGFEVLKKIKRFDPNIHVVMVSGQENMATAIDALKYGAFDYIIKGQHEQARMADVLERIDQISAYMRQAKPSILRRLLHIF